MSTSGSYDFALTRDQIIGLAYQYIGIVGEGGTPSASQVTEAALLLNMIVKLRAADGMPLWALKRGIILPVTGVSSIQTDTHVVTTYDSTTFGAAEAAAQTSITVTSSAAMTAADQIGLELDSGAIQWTTISSVTDATTIVIGAALTSAASSGNKIFSYTASSDRIQKPHHIVEANILNLDSNMSRDIQVMSMSEYWTLTDRTSASIPLAVAYDQVPNSNTNLDDGNIYMYPRFFGGDNLIEFTYHRPFQDFDAASDNPDFPQAFYLPLMLELAALLGPKAQVPLEERSALKAEARMYREEALSTVAPEGSLRVIPDGRR